MATPDWATPGTLVYDAGEWGEAFPAPADVGRAGSLVYLDAWEKTLYVRREDRQPGEQLHESFDPARWRRTREEALAAAVVQAGRLAHQLEALACEWAAGRTVEG